MKILLFAAWNAPRGTLKEIEYPVGWIKLPNVACGELFTVASSL
jgi:hypothetical protein